MCVRTDPEVPIVRELSWRVRSHITRPRILIAGIGRLGWHVLNGLVRFGNADLIATGRDVSKLRVWVNLAVFGAMQATDNVARVEVVGLDLSDVDATAETLARFEPDLIVHCATMQPYTLIAALPSESQRALADAGLGPWLPTQVALADRLMQAIELSGVTSLVVNCAYPDAVNPALAALGRAPLIGAGNIANNEPAIRQAIADDLSVNVSDVSVQMIMHHVVSHRIHSAGDAGGAPFHLSFKIGSTKPGRLTSTDEVFALLASRYRRHHPDAGRQIPALATVALVSALLGSTSRRLHAPGPLGLVGGYPVEINRDRVAIVVPPGMTGDDAIGINKAAQRFDGIDDIGTDGVSFTAAAASVFEETLGHRCPKFRIEEASEWAHELIRRCAELGRSR